MALRAELFAAGGRAEEWAPETWRRFARETAIEHPLRRWIHQDPMTRRSFEKPRGYAGDAVLLDYIYGLRGPDPDLRPASAVYRFASDRPAGASVRKRRQRIAARIDELARERGRPIRVLSIASGHLREAQVMRAFQEGEIEEYVALDSDPASCTFVARNFDGVTTHNASFTRLFREPELCEHFDFVYSAGLFDYLEERLAARLCGHVFRCLRSGGVALVTNFLPSVVDAGYMESYMGWELVYRDRAEIRALAHELPEEQVAAVHVFSDSHRAIGYLEVQRD